PELGNPATPRGWAVEGMRAEPLPPAPALHQFAARALIETDHLAAIVANLRELVQIEAGQVALSLSYFEVRELVMEAATRVLVDRPLELRIPEDLRITADRSKLAQVLHNLLHNAN